jgi:NAD(P)-dependent dehydrogenase (short-subunit alcohol dehydrogenase family)
MRLKDKVAIVVGAGQTPGATLGNGRATALLFAREGARVLVLDRSADSAEETRALIEAEGGVAAVCVTDITDEAQCRAAMEQCVTRFGRVDIWINEAG